MTSDLHHLAQVERGVVYKGDRSAGSLVRLGDTVIFTYDRSYLAGGGRPVATTLPLSATDVECVGGAVPTFFAGLLPEGRRLDALVRAVKTSRDDDMALLLAVGGDAIGDVRVLPEDTSIDEVHRPTVFVDDIARLRFADLLEEVDRSAIPGVQEKVSAGMITLPAATGRHILKIDPPGYPHLAENEAFFLAAAKRCGIDAAEAEVVTDVDGQKGLLVTRFDRTEDGRRIAQEDACQLLDRYPAAKYSVSSEDVVGAITGVAAAGPIAARDFLRQLAFAYLTGNGDAHAKNFSVIDRDGEWFVSPAYDVPSSYPYGDATMALAINGKKRDDIGRSDLLAVAAAGRLPERAATRVVDELVDSVDGWIEGLAGLPFDERTLHKWRRFVEYRRDRLRARQ